MTDKFSFLQPWQAVIRECKVLHDSFDVVDSREFRASQLPIHASICCWPALPNGYEQLAGRCSIPVPFPAELTLRGNRERMRQIREALELFNVLAVVNRPAFLHFLAECIVVADNFADLFTPDFIFVHPVWECYLVGTLRSEDVEQGTGCVTWGELFGCDEDPVQYSEEFCVAMDKLEKMRYEVNGVLSDFMGRQATVEWGNPRNSIEWTAEHVMMPTKGTQISSVDSFPRQFDALLRTEVPVVVQLCAVLDATKMCEELELNSTLQSVETMQPNFSAPGGWQLAAALSCMNLASLRLNLDEIVASASGEACVNAGSLLSTMLCGRSVCTEEHSVPLLQRQGAIHDLQVTFARDSIAGPAGFCSALGEASSNPKLTLNMGALGDQAWWLNQVRWGWLAYALWGSTSHSSIEETRITNIHLSNATVSSVTAALSNSYPPTSLETTESSEFGFVDVEKETKVRPCGLETSDYITVSRDIRCRARYDPGMKQQAEIIVPGYGVCTLQLGDDTNSFIPDYTRPQNKNNRSTGVHSLTMEFFEVETPALIPTLLSSIGYNLRSLRMGMFWTNRRRSVSLDDIAAACPSLNELYLTGFDVRLSKGKELLNWGLKKLVIQSFEEVVGLSDCLSDTSCRLSRELEELEISIPRTNSVGSAYIDTLASHNGDYLAVMQERLPLESKTAMISVVDGSDENHAIHRLNETLMGFSFAFAATPKQRIVRVIS
ncbi:hypothetical protein P3T76_004799 [Phytophthora citrophthora]|uniref:Uncharacterized protein n=1 Tax=Phytophthora citrophthora TaxID=4793 RepID=A0AAD9LN27_9STRA|nr:hypothetical protein P3T76_004799 [Phytophthora citrophthora]